VGPSIKHAVLGGYILKKNNENAHKFVEKAVKAACVTVAPLSEFI